MCSSDLVSLGPNLGPVFWALFTGTSPLTNAEGPYSFSRGAARVFDVPGLRPLFMFLEFDVLVGAEY